ncbi:MAG: hypothetical protein AAF527_06750 [Pseudomonadota bacterium]
MSGAKGERLRMWALRSGGLKQCAAAVALLGGANGCVALNGPTQIVTTPGGAKAELGDGRSCVTPCALPIAREGETRLTLSKVGFKTLSVRYVTTTLRPPPRRAKFELDLIAPTVPVDATPLDAPRAAALQ